MSLQENKHSGTVRDVNHRAGTGVPHFEGLSGNNSASGAGQRQEVPEAGPGKGGRLPRRERAELARLKRV